MSLYAKYVQEKTNKFVVETDYAFATYCYPRDGEVYIEDIYVIPECRMTDVASKMADRIVEEAKRKGCTKLLGSVVPSNKGSTASMKVLLAYGMRLQSCVNDFVIFEKEI